MPWAEWAKGKGITEQRLGRILNDFGVKSKRPRVGGGEKVRGYSSDDLMPVIDRYAPRKNEASDIDASSTPEK